MHKFTKIAAAACFALVGASASAATVVNGSFEDIGTGNTLNNSGWNFFSSVPGWTGDPNVEIQSAKTLSGIDAQDGDNYAELDTNKDGGIYQDIALSVGRHELSFYYSPRVNASPTTTNDMTYAIGTGPLGTAPSLTFGKIKDAPNSTYPWGEWTNVKSAFSVATAGTYTLYFSAEGGSFSSGCGNCGALIDNVSVSAVPVPAAGLLLLSALGGAAALRRRKKAPAA